MFVKSAAPSTLVRRSNDESKGSVRTTVSAGTASTEDQPSSSETPGDTFDCESILKELPAAGPNELQYNRELWETKFKQAQFHCYQLLDFDSRSETHAKVLTRPDGLVHILVGYSRYCRSQLGPVPDNIILLQLDQHD